MCSCLGIWWRERLIYLFESLSHSLVEAVGVSLQNYPPAKVEAIPRQPFDYNGNLSHTLRVGKTQMTHPTYALVGNSGRDFTSQQRNTENFANKKKIKKNKSLLV